jgi:hypothetical protein
MAMSQDNNNPDDDNNVKKYLVGIRTWSWIAIIITSIIFIISVLILAWTLHEMSILPPSNDVIYPPFLIPGSIFGITVGAAIIILYAIAIFGINKRKKFSVKLIRILLILTMSRLPHFFAKLRLNLKIHGTTVSLLYKG